MPDTIRINFGSDLHAVVCQNPFSILFEDPTSALWAFGATKDSMVQGQQSAEEHLAFVLEVSDAFASLVDNLNSDAHLILLLSTPGIILLGVLEFLQAQPPRCRHPDATTVTGDRVSYGQKMGTALATRTITDTVLEVQTLWDDGRQTWDRASVLHLVARGAG